MHILFRLVLVFRSDLDEILVLFKVLTDLNEVGAADHVHVDAEIGHVQLRLARILKEIANLFARSLVITLLIESTLEVLPTLQTLIHFIYKVYLRLNYNLYKLLPIIANETQTLF